MFHRKQFFAMKSGNIQEIDVVRARIEMLNSFANKRYSKDVFVIEEAIFELRAYLRLLSAVQQHPRPLARTSFRPFSTAGKSRATVRLGISRTTEQVLIWTMEHRRVTDRNGLRYPSDSSDGEWQLMQGLIPPIKLRGRKRKVDVREVFNGIFYVLASGCSWNALPKDLPPKGTVITYFYRWLRDGTLKRIHDHLFTSNDSLPALIRRGTDPPPLK
jgi:transposase